MKDKPIYKFIGKNGNFRVDHADRISHLYFPLANEDGLLSAITPGLQGDIKTGQHTFLTIPVTSEDLHLSKSGRNFWISLDREQKPIHWAVNGASAEQRACLYGEEAVSVEGGFLWHIMTRTNQKLGLEARVLSFVPPHAGLFEVMSVRIKNTSSRPLLLKATSAIPLFARSADNIRDHRHVSALLNRVRRTEYGVSVKPTMCFNERGHYVNQTSYYVAGTDDRGQTPVGLYPTTACFAGEGGDLERPLSLYENHPPKTKTDLSDQGKEVMAALQFASVTLNPDEDATFHLFLGIDRTGGDGGDFIAKTYGAMPQIEALHQDNQKEWEEKGRLIRFNTGDPVFNQWVKWVVIQPTLRKIFGNSFLPDFDYGRGGRGWRDLWQDCLALLLAHPGDVRSMIMKNFAGVRLDGSNATIIGKKSSSQTESDGEPEFVADRNNISRVWMDHGTWPFLTTQLYLNQTGDWSIFLEKVPYFRDPQMRRGKKQDLNYTENEKNSHPYQGSLLEHVLIELVVQFFNVGEHNLIRLEDADWNDGLDMASARGESVAFSNVYAGHLAELADVIEQGAERQWWTNIDVLEELLLLLDRAGQRVNYDSIEEKQTRLAVYFNAIEKGVKGTLASISVATLVSDLRAKAAWLKNKINEQEWIDQGQVGWFNGYYDDEGQAVEGPDKGDAPRITLTGQVYPILSNIADLDRIKKIIRAVNEYLWDHELGGIRLNSNFNRIMPHFGRAFGFAYGEKENGAIFSHMVVMYANALYRRGFSQEGYNALNSLYSLSINSNQSRILPGIPEYFNNEGRGRYHFLTGSASWYVYTLLTEVFGVRGESGDLVLAPRLVPDQFDSEGRAEVECIFAESRIKIVYRNPEKLATEDLHITRVSHGKEQIPITRKDKNKILIQRELIQTRKEWIIEVFLTNEN